MAAIERRLDNPLTARPGDEAALDEAILQLNAYPIPQELKYLYEWFCDMSACRGSNGYGPHPLSPSVIRDWQDMSAHYITPWEFELLRRMDRAWLKVYSDLNPPTKADTPPDRHKTIDQQ